MKRSRKYLRILVLMVISQALLTVFVLQWLRSQYKDGGVRLSDELFALYIDTQDQLIDTLLFKNYVGPVLSQHNGDRTIMIAVDDSLRSDSTSNSKAISRSLNWEGRKEAITIRMNHDADGSSLPDTARFRRVNNDFLLRSVKMIVTHSNDSADRGAVIRSLAVHPDTAAFRSNFTKKLEEKGMTFNIRWEDQKGAPISHLSKRLHINPASPFSLPGVTISAYQGFLIKTILPQIVFGVILILLTAMAFLLSYRSLKEHIVLNDMRNEFISNMTHELKTPVATISIALESLRKYSMKDTPEVMEDYLRLASSETKRLEDLINRVLDQSVLEENAGVENMVATDINPVLHEIAGIMQPRLGEGKIEVKTQDGPLNILGDPLLLKGVILNLVDNSIKYCDKTPLIKISSDSDKGNAIITVSDNGPGIPPEYQSKVFEKFFRLPSGNVHNVKGYGLGLSFGALVVKLHKGSISLKNNDAGCSFIIKLPLLR